MLNFAEEVVLLTLDDRDGSFIPIPEWSMQCALAGSVLMDLALENRIDTDLDSLILVDKTPVGNRLLDPTLRRIADSVETHNARYWVEATAAHADDIRETALQRLVEASILKREEDRFLWVFRSRRYPIIDGKAEQEVKLRIMSVLLSDKIPDPRDIVIVCLAEACGIFRELLSRRELEHATSRIEQVRKLDLIGQAVAKSIWEIQASLARAAHPVF